MGNGRLSDGDSRGDVERIELKIRGSLFCSYIWLSVSSPPIFANSGDILCVGHHPTENCHLHACQCVYSSSEFLELSWQHFIAMHIGGFQCGSSIMSLSLCFREIFNSLTFHPYWTEFKSQLCSGSH